MFNYNPPSRVKAGLVTANEIAREVGVGRTLFDNWIEKGWVPAPNHKLGSGVWSMYTMEEAKRICDRINEYHEWKKANPFLKGW